MLKKNNVLFLVAHPDDELLGCGGAIMHHLNKKDNVSVITLSDGESSRYLNESKIKLKKIEQRKKQFIQVMNKLKINNFFNGNFPDNQFDKVSLLEITKYIEKISKSFSPNIVYTHSNADLNIDHQITFRAALTSFRPLKKSTVSKFISFEIPSSTEWSFGSYNNFNPNYFIDISKYMNRKLKLLSFYKNEYEKSDHPRSNEYILALAKIRGISIGMRYAEAFKIIYSKE